MGEQRGWEEIQSALRQLKKPIDDLVRIRIASADGMHQLAVGLGKLPQTGSFAAALDEVRVAAKNFLERLTAERVGQFSSLLAGFLGGLRQKGVAIREVDRAWRIGPLHLELKEAETKARVAYNREPISKWVTVTCLRDLETLMESAEQTLAKARIPGEAFAEALRDAFQFSRHGREQAGSSRPHAIPIREFCCELRVALMRKELTPRNIGGKLKYADLPLWQLLYNLDLYRSTCPAEDRFIAFETGSQSETREGKGIRLNGLDPMEDPQIYCHVIPAGGL